jgi:TorA maturation chaperone TorD
MESLASLDRARVWRSLARLFLPLDAEAFHALRATVLAELRDSLARLGEAREVREAAESLRAHLAAADPARLQSAYEAIFEASGGLRCPPHETAHTAGPPAAGLVRTFELADVAGFYRAFGVEPTPGTERPDHVSVELEFMQLLAAKEAVALADEGDGEHAALCRDAARAFLRDHLGRWAGGFAAALEAGSEEPFYRAAARLLAGFVAAEVARLDAGGEAPPPARPPQ